MLTRLQPRFQRASNILFSFPLAFALASSGRQKQMLLDVTLPAPGMKEIHTKLKTAGYEAGFTVRGFTVFGSYTPTLMANPTFLSTGQIEKDDKITTIHESLDTGEYFAHIDTKLGLPLAAHFFLHEAEHFDQDSHGMFPIWLFDFDVGIPSPEIFIRAICLMEALAEMETLSRAYALKQNGLPHAWFGGLGIDYGPHAFAYWKKIDQGQEEAKLAAFDMWYRHLPNVLSYQSNALRLYEDLGSGSIEYVFL